MEPLSIGLIAAPELVVSSAVRWLRLCVETIGAAIIGLGVIVAMMQWIGSVIRRQQAGYNEIRLTLARYLALALEFQLGADILSTAFSPTWEQIGKLGAIAVIRIALNYFLTREMEFGYGCNRNGYTRHAGSGGSKCA